MTPQDKPVTESKAAAYDYLLQQCYQLISYGVEHGSIAPTALGSRVQHAERVREKAELEARKRQP